MKDFLIKILLSTLGIIIVNYILPGTHLDSIATAFGVAIVLALLNYFVKPILIIFTIPITFLTLGLFLIVINAFIVLIVDEIVVGFRIDSFLDALLFSILLSITMSFINSFRNKKD